MPSKKIAKQSHFEFTLRSGKILNFALSTQKTQIKMEKLVKSINKLRDVLDDTEMKELQMPNIVLIGNKVNFTISCFSPAGSWDFLGFWEKFDH
jgi:hypothetical protein